MSNSDLTVAVTPAPERTVSPLVAWIKRHPLIAYFVMAFAGSWLVMSPLVLGQDGSGLLAYTLPDWLYLVIYIISPYTGPALAAYLVIAAERGRPGVRTWLRRFVQWRVVVHWYLVAIFGVLAAWLVALSMVYQRSPLQVLAQLEVWSLFATFFLMGIVVPGYGEEPGWRGYALPKLQERYGPVGGSFVLGIMHGLWHLPVFFTPFLGPFTLLTYSTFLLTALAMTFVYTWIYNNTRGSILIAVLVHAAINASSTALTAAFPADAPLPGWREPFVQDGWLNVCVFGVAALLLLIATRGTLSYRGINELE